KAAVDHADRDPCGLGDGRHRGRFETAVLEQRLGRREEAVEREAAASLFCRQLHGWLLTLAECECKFTFTCRPQSKRTLSARFTSQNPPSAAAWGQTPLHRRWWRSMRW